jgi:hypothetical protein
MLIVNDAHLCLAGRSSLEERWKEISMQEAYLRQMKTAMRDQAFDFASESVLRHRGRRRGQA